MTRKLAKYEKLYREGRDILGPPFRQVVEFFAGFGQRQARVLDLGCGQGRDALFIARLGHSVLGVDLSATGIAQMLDAARQEGLAVEGLVADIVGFEPDGAYDVILLDRVLHMLPDDGDRRSVLEAVCRHTAPGGFVLIADTPANKGFLASFFAEREDRWEKQLEDKGFFFVRREHD